MTTTAARPVLVCADAVIGTHSHSAASGPGHLALAEGQGYAGHVDRNGARAPTPSTRQTPTARGEVHAAALPATADSAERWIPGMAHRLPAWYAGG